MLKLYENIKKRRIELNMSQQELAELVGYKGKSMISQIERGCVDISESMIMKFAEVLKISPWKLMGQEDELETFDTPEAFERRWRELGGGRHPIDLTDKEYDLIVNYRAASEEDQKMVDRILSYVKQAKGGMNDGKP